MESAEAGNSAAGIGLAQENVARPPAPPRDARIAVDLGAAGHSMAGGIGASWHAISKEFKIPQGSLHGWKDTLNSRGSAWGGNPPVEWEDTWHQVLKHATWLGLNWNRVEFSQRMYEPARGEFDWDNEEMQALYRILDWCEKSEVDVFRLFRVFSGREPYRGLRSGSRWR